MSIEERIKEEGEAADNAASPNGAEPKRKRGRPKGSKNKPKDGTQAKSSSDSFDYVPDDASVNTAAFLAKTIWWGLSQTGNFRPLTDDEALELGQALDPVMQKYLPALNNWIFEANAVFVLINTIQKTHIKKQPVIDTEPDTNASGSGAEVIE